MRVRMINAIRNFLKSPVGRQISVMFLEESIKSMNNLKVRVNGIDTNRIK